MDQGIIVAILSMLFYLSSLLGGGTGQTVQPLDTPMTQQSYQVFGQGGKVVADSVTVRSGPSNEAEAIGTVHKNTEELILLDYSPGWYKIRPSVGPTGWVPEYSVTQVAVQREEQDHVILGLYTPGAPAYGSLLDHGSQLTSVSPFGWELDSYGGLVTNFDPAEMGRSLYFAGNQELETYAHLHVPSNPDRLLNNAYLQQNSINQLIGSVEEWGLKGLLVELTYLPGTEQPQLFEFLRTLASELRAKGFKTLLAIPWDPSIDYRAASTAVDYIVLQTAASLEVSAPLAPLPHVEAMVKEVIQQVETSRLVLALTTSGRDWARTGVAQELSHDEVLQLAARQGANVRWDPDSMSPFFQYGNGHEVWFENRYSLKYKLELISKYNLGGIALQDLGQEDPELWATLASLVG
ncbi:MAG: SH3 domain-containing protein [Firmicutes bacterium]|nr:SH3 domain-containing protein [Bacillota bacterium]